MIVRKHWFNSPGPNYDITYEYYCWYLFGFIPIYITKENIAYKDL